MDMSLEKFGVMYAMVTLFSSLLLTQAYSNVSINTEIALGEQRKNVRVSLKKLGLSKEQFSAKVAANTKSESIAWSLFRNNIVFVALFLVLGFYILQDVEPQYRHTLSVTLSSAVVW